MAARTRSSVARPPGELPSWVGMTVTTAVPRRRQSAGATALWTPSTPARACATTWGSPERTSASNGESGPVPRPEP